MKKLWKYIPPCYSDVQGFQAILSISDGLGIIDDPSGYKKVKPSFEVSSHKKEKGHKKDHHKKGSRKDKENENVINSKIRNDDIINGTSAKVQACVKKALSKKKPDFILLSLAPSSSMIGSDLGFEAQMIEQDYNIPSLALDIHGDKDYVYGMSQTLLAMGKLLLSKQETKENSINLIGCNPLDFSEQAYLEIKEFLSQSYSIVSVWGMKESTENLKKACQASLNVVVHSCGLRLAKYMKEEFGIPYIVCVQYGKKQCQALFEQKT
ncbi:MAG: nitrogenase component 1, partial [Floccifex sp.]